MQTNFARQLMSGTSFPVLILAAASLLAVSAQAGTLPGPGHFTSGSGDITKHGSTLAVDQDSRTGIVKWSSFSIGKKNSVTFDNTGGATLNEIHGGNISRIAGDLRGTGSVYLINTAGIVIGKSGRIDTQGSFAASGGSADNFGAGKRLHFTATPKDNVIDKGSVTSHNGRVDLYGNRVGVHGTITARSAETSGERVNVNGAQIDANWLVDPKDLKVTSSAASSIEHSLAHHNVTLKTTASSCSGPGKCVGGGYGNILVDAPITWSSTKKLTLNAYEGIYINDDIHLAGNGALAFVTHYDSQVFFSTGEANFSSTDASLTINGTDYLLVRSIAELASHITSAPSGDFALAKNLNAASLGTFSSSPIPTTFTGSFSGLGHTISNLKISDSTHGFVGLFSQLGTGGSIAGIALDGANIVSGEANAKVGALVGSSNGSLFDDTSSGSVKGGQSAYVGGIAGASGSGTIAETSSSASVVGGNYAQVGGLVGYANPTADIDYSSASGTVSAGYEAEIGGLVGDFDGTLSNSSATGSVSSSGTKSEIGGLVGIAAGGMISYSSATGTVTGSNLSYAGGLIGSNEASLTSDSATGTVKASVGSTIGGLVATNSGSIDTSHASGNVSGDVGARAGGLVGYNASGAITGSYAVGKVTVKSDSNAGGLVGELIGGSIANSHANGGVSGSSTQDTYLGGLVGQSVNGTTITDTYATGNVTAASSSFDVVGGLIGLDEGGIVISYAAGNVSAADGANDDVGGFAGNNGSTGSLSKNYATGAATGGDAGATGGFVGDNTGLIYYAYERGTVSDGQDGNIGGFAGVNANGAEISQAYSTGAVTPGVASTAGGLVGDDASTGGITNAYWDRQTSGISAKSQGAGNVSNDSGITGLTTSQLKGGMATGLSASTWTIDNTKNNGFPYLTQNPPN